MSPPALSFVESGADAPDRPSAGQPLADTDTAGTDMTGFESTQGEADRIERFRTIYESTHPAIQAYCRRRTDSTSADDAVSEVFLTAWRRFDEEGGLAGADPKLWLFGVARRVLANQRRGSTRRDELHLRLVTDTATSETENAAAPDEPVLVALATLSDSDQEILRLVTWEELSLADAGEVLGCTANAAGIRAHRARTRLAEALDNNARPDNTEGNARPDNTEGNARPDNTEGNARPDNTESDVR